MRSDRRACSRTIRTLLWVPFLVAIATGWGGGLRADGEILPSRERTSPWRHVFVVDGETWPDGWPASSRDALAKAMGDFALRSIGPAPSLVVVDGQGLDVLGPEIAMGEKETRLRVSTRGGAIGLARAVDAALALVESHPGRSFLHVVSACADGRIWDDLHRRCMARGVTTNLIVIGRVPVGPDAAAAPGSEPDGDPGGAPGASPGAAFAEAAPSAPTFLVVEGPWDFFRVLSEIGPGEPGGRDHAPSSPVTRPPVAAPPGSPGDRRSVAGLAVLTLFALAAAMIWIARTGPRRESRPGGREDADPDAEPNAEPDAGQDAAPGAEPDPEPHAEPDAAPDDGLARLLDARDGSVRIVLSRVRTTAGRDGVNDLVLDDPAAARRHFEVDRAEGAWVLRVRAGAGAVLVDDRRVEELRLRSGACIRVGRVALVFAVDRRDEEGAMACAREHGGGETWYCRHCGARLEGRPNFCRHCGEVLDSRS